MCLRKLFQKNNNAAIRFHDAGRGLAVYRYGSESGDLPLLPGLRIEVASDQMIAFVQNGELVDTWDEGSYVLGATMFPGLAERGAFTRADRPVPAELYFLNLTRITDRKWATRTPVLRNENGKLYAIRAFGKMAYRIQDGIGFILEAFLNRKLQTSFELNDYLATLTAGAFAAVAGEQNLPVTEIINHYASLSDLVLMKANQAAAPLGVEITGVLIEGASLPD
ncbi:MAG: SPFH domain-containing protein [Lachnospiraceae bacterium]|nr:SPFH domain-containing protein [Lachnospiraceae bacterium]